MSFLLSMIILSFVISAVLLLLGLLLSFKSLNSVSKNSPFECGFLPKNVQRSSFSVQFFLVALIFLIFDVEVIILYPFLLVKILSLFSFIVLLMFVFILLGGLMLEWSQGSLEWLR